MHLRARTWVLAWAPQKELEWDWPLAPVWATPWAASSAEAWGSASVAATGKATGRGWALELGSRSGGSSALATASLWEEGMASMLVRSMEAASAERWGGMSAVP